MLKISVTGDCMIFRNEKDGKVWYNTQQSHKKDGEWENGNIGIRFRKGVDIPNKTKITITEGWLDFYLKNNSKYDTEKYIFCNAFESEDMPPKIPEGFQALEDDDDIPF